MKLKLSKALIGMTLISCLVWGAFRLVKSVQHSATLSTYQNQVASLDTEKQDNLKKKAIKYNDG